MKIMSGKSSNCSKKAFSNCYTISIRAKAHWFLGSKKAYSWRSSINSRLRPRIPRFSKSRTNIFRSYGSPFTNRRASKSWLAWVRAARTTTAPSSIWSINSCWNKWFAILFLTSYWFNMNQRSTWATTYRRTTRTFSNRSHGLFYWPTSFSPNSSFLTKTQMTRSSWSRESTGSSRTSKRTHKYASHLLSNSL